MIDAKDAVGCVLRLLKKHNFPLDKILIHKFIFFIDTQGFRIGLHFEPWTYGPFSFDLARVLDDMVFWDKIKKNKYGFEILNLDTMQNLEKQEEARIEDLLVTFHNIVGEFNFENLECIGTTLYCATSLSFQGKEVDKDKIIDEFKAWKGERYSSETIGNAFDRLKEYLQ